MNPAIGKLTLNALTRSINHKQCKKQQKIYVYTTSKHLYKNEINREKNEEKQKIRRKRYTIIWM